MRLTIEQAIDAAYKQWEEGNCHEPGCGCVTQYIKNAILPIIEQRDADLTRLARAQGIREALATHDTKIHYEGACWMLESVIGSLRGYPDRGGDIRVMAEVDRIKAEHDRQVQAEMLKKVEDVIGLYVDKFMQSKTPRVEVAYEIRREIWRRCSAAREGQETKS